MTTLGVGRATQKGNLLNNAEPSLRTQVVLTAVVLISLVVMPTPSWFLGRGSLALLIVLLSAILVWNRLRSHVPSNATVLLVGWLVLLAYVVAIAAAEIPRYALEAAIAPLGAIALFVLFGSGLLSRQSIVVGFSIVGTVLALLVLVDFGGQVVRWVTLMTAVAPDVGFIDSLPLTPPRAKVVPALHPNISAALVYVGGLSALGLTRVPEYRIAAWVSTSLTFAALLATGSRGGLVAALVGGGVVVLTLTRSAKVQRRRPGLLVAGVIAALVAVIVVLWVTGLRPDFIFRATWQDRLPVMDVGLSMFGDSPLVGQGPGAFRNLFPVYAPDLYPGGTSRLIWTSAHNGYVQSLLEIGLLGTSLVGMAVAVVVIRLGKSGHLEDPWARIVMASALGAVAAFLVHSVVDSLATNLLPLAFLAVLVGGSLSGGGPSASGSNWLITGAILIPALVVPILVAATFQAHLHYLKGREAILAGHVDVSIDEFSRAFYSDPLPVYAQALSFSLAEASRPLPEGQLFDTGPFVPATIALNKAAVLIDDNPVVASSLLDQVELHVRGDEVGVIEYGHLRLLLGEEEEAIGAISLSLFVNPWLASSPFLDRLSPDIRQRALDRGFSPPCSIGDVWILTGAASETQINELASACDEKSSTGLMARLEQGQVQKVLVDSEFTLGATPGSIPMRRVAGLAANQAKLVESARTHWAIAALLGDPYSAFELAASYESNPPAEVLVIANQLSNGFSPVIIGASSRRVYALAAAAMSLTGYREPLPTLLADGVWQEAVTRLHAQMKQLAADQAG